MDTKTTLRHFILENFLFTDEDAALGDDDSLVARGIIDSMGVLEVIEFLENRFGIKVAEAEMVPDNLDSVTKLEAYVTRKAA